MTVTSVYKKAKVFILITIVAHLPIQASAWGMIGHRVVGQIAEYYLTARARKIVKSILRNESVAMASNWADLIKSDTAYNYLYSWHYVNLPSGLNQQGVFNFLDTDKPANVYNKVPEQIAILKNKQSTSDQKLLAMRLLIHLIGDLHQPMHTARKEDLGGNKIIVTWFGEKSNLHRVWDEELIEYQQLSYTEYAEAINHPTDVQLRAWKASSLKQAVFESYTVCNQIYTGVKPDDKLSYRYNFDYVSILNEALLKGGIRLAQILNSL